MYELPREIIDLKDKIRDGTIPLTEKEKILIIQGLQETYKIWRNE